MNWDITFWLLGGLAVSYVVLSIVVKFTGGYAPGWQLRCTKCGHTSDAAKAGIIRIGARSIGKRIRGNYSQCDGKVLALERKMPDHDSAASH